VTGEPTDDDLLADDLGAVGPGLKPSRAIGGSLNALVRATILYRKGVEKWDATADGSAVETMKMMAERTAKALRKAKPNALELEALRVLVGGDTALRANKDYTQWVLFAFMAGVRRIKPRRAMTADDVIRLVHALVALEPTVESIERFRDWIDADGAEGFEVRVHTSFREVFEEVDLEEEREFSKAFAMARFEVPRSGDAVYIAAKDLDKVAMRKEFEMPIEMYSSGAMSAAGGMTDDELEQVGKRCDDANDWAMAELEAVLAIPALRSAVTPEHMARRVVTRLSEEADEQFLSLLTRLNSRTDPFRQAVARALGTREVGEIIARQLRLAGDDSIEALGKFLVLSPQGIASAVVTGLIDRGTEDAGARYAAAALAQWYGSAQFSEWVLAPSLSNDAAAVVGGAFGKCAPDTAAVTRVVGAAPIEAGLSLLRALPPSALTVHGRAVRLVWGRADPETVEQVAELMIASGDPDNLKMLGDLLLAGKLGKWPGRVIYALCRALIEKELGRSHVVALVLDQRAEERLRLIAIDCLQNQADLAAEACRFRFARFFDPAMVKTRLKKLAKQHGRASA
jgi:hypothetical protein